MGVLTYTREPWAALNPYLEKLEGSLRPEETHLRPCIRRDAVRIDAYDTEDERSIT